MMGVAVRGGASSLALFTLKDLIGNFHKAEDKHSLIKKGRPEEGGWPHSITPELRGVSGLYSGFFYPILSTNYPMSSYRG
jgi:hypothetical protein